MHFTWLHEFGTLQVDVSGHVRHTHTLDFSNVTEEELRTIL
jgi:hypothetical protein